MHVYTMSSRLHPKCFISIQTISLSVGRGSQLIVIFGIYQSSLQIIIIRILFTIHMNIFLSFDDFRLCSNQKQNIRIHQIHTQIYSFRIYILFFDNFQSISAASGPEAPKVK